MTGEMGPRREGRKVLDQQEPPRARVGACCELDRLRARGRASDSYAAVSIDATND